MIKIKYTIKCLKSNGLKIIEYNKIKGIYDIYLQY